MNHNTNGAENIAEAQPLTLNKDVGGSCIVAWFQPQYASSSGYYDQTGAGFEVDVTGEVLALSLTEIQDLEDDTDSTNDLVSAEKLGHDGPHRIEVLDAICRYFNVDLPVEITQSQLDAARVIASTGSGTQPEGVQSRCRRLAALVYMDADPDAVFPAALAGYAAYAAAKELLKNWEQALADGSTDNLIADVDDVIAHLTEFKVRASVILPAQNARTKVAGGSASLSASHSELTARQVMHLPSAEGHGEYDLYALAPDGMSAQTAKEIIDRQILRANTEDAQSEPGGCDDEQCVQHSIRHSLGQLGFEIFEPTMTKCWDQSN